MANDLLIDEQAASLNLDSAALRLWGQRQRVFVSSLITDLADERRAAREAIESIGAHPVMFEEELGAQDVRSNDAYIGGVRTSTIYVGIFGSRYGARTASGYSATEEEFREAQRQGLRLCIFTNTANGEVDGGQRDLIDGARNLLTTSPWTDPADLVRRVGVRLADLAAEELVPWVKLGDVVFRATNVFRDSETVIVEADILNPRILTLLSEYQKGRVSTLRFTSPHGSQVVQLRNLSSSMSSTIGQSVTLTFTVGQPEQTMRMGTLHTNGATYSQEDLARMSITDALFGTRTSPQTWSKGDDGEDLLGSIRGKGIVDRVVRPVARLLIIERLLRTGDASHVDSFTLGPSQNGHRFLRLTWSPPRAYSNSPTPDPVAIEGQLKDL